MRTSDLTAADIIRILDLKPLPVEGGYYCQTYLGDLRLPKEVLPASIKSDRAAASVIYYMLTADTKSRLHRLETDEVWHYYMGDSVELCVFGSDIDYTKHTLGHRLAGGPNRSSARPSPQLVWRPIAHGRQVGAYGLLTCASLQR